MSTVLITGANRGIGLALAKEYAERGDSVLAACREPQKAQALHALSQHHSVTLLTLSVDSETSVKALASALAATSIDIVINNAGIIGKPGEQQDAIKIDFSTWAEMFAINTMAPVRIMQALLPQLKRSTQPKVMNITSDLGSLAHDDAILFGYSASKAALNKYMRLAAMQLKAEGVAIGLVHPGWVQTDMGGSQAPVDPTTSAKGIVRVIDQLDINNTGSFWQWDGQLHEW